MLTVVAVLAEVAAVASPALAVAQALVPQAVLEQVLPDAAV